MNTPHTTPDKPPVEQLDYEKARDELAEVARVVDWRSEPARVFSLARAAYTYANAALLWSPGRTRLPAPGDLIGRILPLLRVT